ncbi:hypothetical protein B0H14DRAFT_2569528 [Mycena olivaceomarginata]|nr:hypothetical protein B0H14DRAFT_2569528 [Mycena olivaceomarginata]
MSAHRQLNMISFPQLNWLALDAEGNSNDSWSTEAIIIRDAQSLLSLRLTALDFRPFPDATLALSVLEWSPNVVDFRGRHVVSDSALHLQVGNSIQYLKLLNVWFYHQLEVLKDPGDLLPRLERLETDGTPG